MGTAMSSDQLSGEGLKSLLNKNLGRMDWNCHLAHRRLRGHQDPTEATVQGVAELVSRADLISLLAGDNLLKMPNISGEGKLPEGAGNPVTYFDDVLRMLHQARVHLETDNMLGFAQDMFNIRSAMDAVSGLDPNNVDFQDAYSTSSATRASSDTSSDSLTVVLKHFLHEGGLVEKRKPFTPFPDFALLHDLGTSLLRENNLVVWDFHLKLDETVLGNNNTKEELNKRKGCQNVLIFLMLAGPQPWSFSRAPSRGMQPTSGPEKLLICIEGNIGSRKSDFMGKLEHINAHRQQSVRVIREPIYKDGLAEEMAQFYDALAAGQRVSEKQKEQSSVFEEKMFQHHLKVATDPQERAMHVISERSMASKMHVFNELNYEQGRLLQKYRDDMQAQFNASIEGHPQHQPHAVILFEISVPEAMARIEERGRPSEKHITEDYLKAIEMKYEQLYPKGAANVIRVQPSEQPMEDLIVDVKDKLQATLHKSDFVSQVAIDDFLKFFQDERPEPPA